MKLQEKGALKAFLQVRPLEDVLLRLMGDEECDAFFCTTACCRDADP